MKLWQKMCDESGQHEVEIERYFDHYPAMHTMLECVGKKKAGGILP